MFTTAAIFLAGITAWLAQRANERDRATYDPLLDDGNDFRRAILLHIRQDLKVVAFLLAAVVVMLGVVADRI